MLNIYRLNGHIPWSKYKFRIEHVRTGNGSRSFKYLWKLVVVVTIWRNSLVNCHSLEMSVMKKIGTHWVHVSTAVNKAGWMLVDGSRIRQSDLVAFVDQLLDANVASWIPSSLRTNNPCFWLVPDINARPFIDSYSHYAYITLHTREHGVFSFIEAVDTKIRLIIRKAFYDRFKELCHLRGLALQNQGTRKAGNVLLFLFGIPNMVQTCPRTHFSAVNSTKH